jgi:hypothetical protein
MMTFIMVVGWFGVVIGSYVAAELVLKKLNLYNS